MPKPRQSVPVVPRMTDVKGGCAIIGCGKSRLYELMQSGEIESYLDGAARKVSIESCNRFVDRRLAQSRSTFERARHPQHEMETA
jgi:hypothetical protein